MLLFPGVITTFRPEWEFVLRKMFPSADSLPVAFACVLMCAPTVWILLSCFQVLGFGIYGIQAGKIIVCSFHFKSKGRAKVLLVADHHVNKRCKLPIYLLRLALPADRFPKRSAIVQIIGDNDAVSL